MNSLDSQISRFAGFRPTGKLNKIQVDKIEMKRIEKWTKIQSWSIIENWTKLRSGIKLKNWTDKNETS